jgi:hypothetical protein
MIGRLNTREETRAHPAVVWLVAALVARNLRLFCCGMIAAYAAFCAKLMDDHAISCFFRQLFAGPVRWHVAYGRCCRRSGPPAGCGPVESSSSGWLAVAWFSMVIPFSRLPGSDVRCLARILTREQICVIANLSMHSAGIGGESSRRKNNSLF